MNSNWKPQRKSTEILERAWEHIQSVDYEVSARWLFYRLLQDGLYKDKEDYGRFIDLVSAARKNFYGMVNYQPKWSPKTLADETRTILVQRGNYRNATDYFSAMAGKAYVPLDEWYSQPNYVIVGFEALAMQQQFQHYAPHVTLVPFKGDPSIPFKWKVAREEINRAKKYNVPIIFLYFGDLDKKGQQIPVSAITDVKAWASCDFVFKRCGLTIEQAADYNVPENPEKPGEFQWEAVPDEGAGKIITSAIAPYIDDGAFKEIEEKEKIATKKIREKMAEAVLEL